MGHVGISVCVLDEQCQGMLPETSRHRSEMMSCYGHRGTSPYLQSLLLGKIVVCLQKRRRHIIFQLSFLSILVSNYFIFVLHYIPILDY